MMQSTLLERKRRRRRQQVIVAGGLVLFLLVLFIAEASSPHALRSIFVSIVRPLWSGGSTGEAAAGSFLELLRSKRSLVDENRALKAELVELRLKLIDRDRLFSENQELKEFLGRDTTGASVLAALLSRPPTTPYDTFVIDVGEDAAVRKGDRVVVAESIALGEVIEVYDRTSLVSLYSTPGKETEVLLGPEGIAASATGRGSGNFLVRMPRDFDVSIGDPVVLPGISGETFALVEEVVESPADSFKTILFKNPVNFAQIRWVSVRLTR